MKKLFKTIMVAIFLSLSATAFAQCMTINQPGPPRIWDGARCCYVPQGTPALGTANSGVVQQYIQPQYYNGNTLPFGVQHGSSNECAGLFERIGRVAGANHGNDARHTENGGFGGYILGKFFCPTPARYVHQGQGTTLVPVDMQGGGMTESRSQTVRAPAKCALDNGLTAYTYEGQAGCDKLAAAMAKRVESKTVTASNTSVPVPYCQVYGPGGALKKVVNADRRDAYCGEIIRDLQARKISWNDLQTVN